MRNRKTGRKWFTLETYGGKPDIYIDMVSLVEGRGFDTKARCDVCTKSPRQPKYIIESFKELWRSQCGHPGCTDHRPYVTSNDYRQMVNDHFKQHDQDELDQWTAMQVLTRS